MEQAQDMFETLKPPKPPRAKARVMMHFTDGGYVDGLGDAGVFECRKCGHETGWIAASTKDFMRGVPCPTCNKPPNT